ncbi:hypothetical protein Ddye_018216 [Dipteronia dyeriana]|uniref:Reverse transcriptase n=1 Tax=Dipteronia dyeriana TaxID=168575 RepID=A0AAD9UAU6_9ROSI|nr:hypothetical protein Ddye_018216 [Dipteronia dyeriana]
MVYHFCGVFKKKIDKDVVLCNVYASTLEHEIRELWGRIRYSQQTLSLPWCIWGDFHTILHASERKVGVFNRWSAMINFNDFIIRTKVFDLPLHGIPFTWSNNKVKGAWARLDRFLVSLIILSWFPNIVQRSLPRSISDHSAIILGVSKDNWGSSPFRLFNGWLGDKELLEEEKLGWPGYKVSGSSSRLLQTKLKLSTLDIKQWAANKSKDSVAIKALEDNLADLEVRARNDGWSNSFREERLKTLAEYWKVLGRRNKCGDNWKVLRKEDQMWLQKSRIKWL